MRLLVFPRLYVCCPVRPWVVTLRVNMGCFVPAAFTIFLCFCCFSMSCDALSVLGASETIASWAPCNCGDALLVMCEKA